jgi:hypothetical protein
MSASRRNTLIDPRNYVYADRWFRVDDRIAWWDRYLRLWTLFYCEPGTPYQRGPCEYYNNAQDLIAGEADQPTTWNELEERGY